MNKIRILLTGGSGMVGRNLLEHSCIDNFEVLAPASSELNLLDFNAVQEYLERYEPNLIIHAAGKVGGIQANIREPVRFLLDNLDMGRNIVWAARTAGVKRLINLGSSCMYPRNHSEPLSEDMVLKGELEPTNEGYALAKVTTARLCEYIARENANFQYKTLIPCNIFGRFDKFEPSHSHLLPAIIHKIHIAKMNNDPTVEIWGDGTARREFLYAGDLAGAILKALPDPQSTPATMNIGLGSDYSVNEYYAAAAAVIGYSGSFTHDLDRPVGMKRKLTDVNRARAWGWQAETALEDGIRKTYEFYLDTLHGR